MGSSQSSLAKPIDKNAIEQCKDEGGRKSQKDTIPALKRSSVSIMVTESLEELTASDTYHTSFKSIVEISDDESVVSTDSEEEDDEEWEERLRILEDARNLKKVAEFFSHPEIGVESSVGVSRCIFDRPSAPERLSLEDANEKAAVLEDAVLLKKAAVDYAHPELPVESTDATACARCYFSRSSAETDDDASLEERNAVLADIKALKEAAVDYLHPEFPVRSETSACARNFFTRPSAALVEDPEEMERVLEDSKQLKKLAVDYLHPENPVVTDDPACFGRNYFTRSSADVQEDHDERLRILEDVRNLKEAAGYYMHPEIGVESSVGVTRCVFDRPSASGRLTKEEADDKAAVLEEAYNLKKSAAHYMHPELPVAVDATACARNYFSRPAAVECGEVSNEERTTLLEDIKALKQTAVDYLHPELPVVSSGSACARNYFTRPSAVVEDDISERDLVLQDAKNLKKLAVDYLHPEKPVYTNDPTCFGRNYFSRPSAADQDTSPDERNAAIADVIALKTLATDFLHPERPVVTNDPTVYGRNYFERAAAPDTDDADLAAERECVLADAKALKSLAVDYLHPEKPVVTSDPMATGRNFFDRPSNLLHNQMVHTFPPHEDDLEHHHEHMDHFGMDEDFVFSEFRNEMAAPIEENKPKVVAGSDVGSNLSRSPSSVMLFNEEFVE